MHNKMNFINLYKDADFKTTFIGAYLDCGEHINIAEKEYSNAFAWLAEDSGTEQRPPLSTLPINEVKRGFLAIAAYGLSFDRKSKEVYLFCDVKENGRLSFGSVLGYRGMQRLMANTKGLRFYNTEMVYSDDSFTWLGADQRPSYTSNGRSQDTDLVCAFTTFTFDDGSVICHRTNAAELLEIERQSIEQTTMLEGSPIYSLYNTAWRERCLRICALRAAFREYKHLFLKNQHVFVDEFGSSDGDLGAFEKLLQESEQQVTA